MPPFVSCDFSGPLHPAVCLAGGGQSQVIFTTLKSTDCGSDLKRERGPLGQYRAGTEYVWGDLKVGKRNLGVVAWGPLRGRLSCE